MQLVKSGVTSLRFIETYFPVFSPLLYTTDCSKYITTKVPVWSVFYIAITAFSVTWFGFNIYSIQYSEVFVHRESKILIIK